MDMGHACKVQLTKNLAWAEIAYIFFLNGPNIGYASIHKHLGYCVFTKILYNSSGWIMWHLILNIWKCLVYGQVLQNSTDLNGLRWPMGIMKFHSVFILVKFLDTQVQKNIKEFHHVWKFRNFPYTNSLNSSKEICPWITW